MCLGCCLPVDARLLLLQLILLNFDSQYEAAWGIERDTDTGADIDCHGRIQGIEGECREAYSGG